MVGLVEASRLMWCQGLADLAGKPDTYMHEWLSAATFAPSVSSNIIELTGIDRQHLLRAFAGDINRIASAASETLHNIAEVAAIPKSLAWPYVKLYYAALFYAHALLRIWGRSPSYLRTSDLINLRQTLVAYGVQTPYKLTTGQFSISTDMSIPILRIGIDNKSGGSHEAIWREFYRGLNDLRQLVLRSPFVSKDKEIIDSQLTTATDLLSNNGSNLFWPSYMRNEIQYRQTEGLWYPYKGHARAENLVIEMARILKNEVDIRVPLSVSGSNLSRFRAACYFVIIMSRSVVADLGNKSGANGFLRFGQIQFEKAIARAE